MPKRRDHRGNRFDGRARLPALLCVAACVAALEAPAGSQLLDATLDDVLDRQIAEQVEADLARAIEDAVEDSVEADVSQRIEGEVASAVEQQLEAEIVNAVQQQVESGVVTTIATEVESSVAAELGQQLIDAVESGVGALEDTTPAERGSADNAAADARSERFVAGVDAAGRAIERQVWIILVPAEHAARIDTWGFTVRERRDLPTLDRVLLRVAAPEDRDIARAALELALDAPGTEVDFNHLYRPGDERDNAAERTLAGAVPAPRGAPAAPQELAVGVVDTAVAAEHEALAGADIVQRDFVPFDAERPTAHGTAVASILVGAAPKLEPQLRGGRVYAASVFFADPAGNDASTAASLALAGEWLAEQRVRVINMSLAGPPNRVLEAAIEALVARDVIVVAAVGNNGPRGEPLYPAAYESVVAVTAIDAARRIYRYANRGPHVTFAALGVDVPVARSGGGYRELTGTSVAAPHAAAIIARTVAGSTSADPAAVLGDLKRTAVDLGAEDFDNVFGFGLIAPLEPVTASR